jgi:hypothetical protein
MFQDSLLQSTSEFRFTSMLWRQETVGEYSWLASRFMNIGSQYQRHSKIVVAHTGIQEQLTGLPVS